jgi:hypothetical protein
MPGIDWDLILSLAAHLGIARFEIALIPSLLTFITLALVRLKRHMLERQNRGQPDLES